MTEATAASTSADLLVVGISELAVSDRTGEILVTYSLGSCIGVSLFDPVTGIGGLIHCMLPLSKVNAEKAEDKPAMFVDTGMAALVDAMASKGADKERLIVKVAGGASPIDQSGRFKIGERNVTVLRKFLWKNDLLIAAQDTGGTQARTMRLYVETGVTTIRSGGEEVEL